jgi:hypothetical protein
MTFNDLRATFVGTVECFQIRLSVGEYFLTILVDFGFAEEENFLEWQPRYFMFNLEDFLCLGLISLGAWDTSLFVDELIVLCN